MTPDIALLTPAQKRQAKRAANLAARNEKIREAFAERYTRQPRPRKVTREDIVKQLAEEFFLSIETVENILYKQTI
ncbi:MAG: hypothetical protein EOO63_05175 [Hymenobacter sp.]|nr:MAG: hypothetical protein EOO63_05175 [Hymenobacter sp.]